MANRNQQSSENAYGGINENISGEEAKMVMAAHMKRKSLSES
jgi:hypothetical protein